MDHRRPGTFIQVSGGLLLVYGIASIVGPTVAGLPFLLHGAPKPVCGLQGQLTILLVIFGRRPLRTAPRCRAERQGQFPGDTKSRALYA